MGRVFLTGGSGKAGRFVSEHLLSRGYEVCNGDIASPKFKVGPYSDDGRYTFVRLDTTSFDDVFKTMDGCDYIVHLAAIPSPISVAEHELFRINMLSNWNVLEAAERHGIRKVVMASSINAVGAVFSKNITPRPYFPIDEEQGTFCEDAYSQSKWLGEEMAYAFCRRRSMQIASMRFHALWTRREQASRRKAIASGSGGDPNGISAKHFWGWTDIEEAAEACRLALEAEWDGHESFFINGNDTCEAVPTIELVKKSYPDSEIRKELPGVSTAISNDKAKLILGWRPTATWRKARNEGE